MKQTKEVRKKLLRNNGLSVTPTRLSILELFAGGCDPLNAEQIARKLSRQRIDLVTVYRTLEAFEKKAILRKVDLRQGSNFYEFADSHHHHIVCTSCDKIEEFENKEVEMLIQKAAAKSSKFKIIDQHALELFGICTSCARK
jgi:Fur family ferric uptake transcriptional regulator